MKCSDMKCRRCNRAAHEIGGYLQRVNEKGVPGIWECRPNCSADLPDDVALILAIEGEPADVEVSPECAHNNTTTHYDCVTCNDCGAICTDSGWGIARNQWFKSRSDAEFYKKNGRLPEPPK